MLSVSSLGRGKHCQSTGVPWAQRCRLPDEPGCWAGPSSPCRLLLCGDHTHRGVWPRCQVCPCLHNSCPHSYPLCLSAHWRYQKFPNFQSSFSIFSIYVGFYNGSWPEKVQHLPHTDTGPFPVLGVSVLCWSNSDSNFKIFSAAISWQDSTSLPIPWLIRGG